MTQPELTVDNFRKKGLCPHCGIDLLKRRPVFGVEVHETGRVRVNENVYLDDFEVYDRENVSSYEFSCPECNNDLGNEDALLKLFE